jgi:hypothetical protein
LGAAQTISLQSSFVFGFSFDINLACDSFRGLPMTEDELNALRLLLREELQAELKPFRAEVGKRFDELGSHIDGLYQRKEAAGVFLAPRTDQTT